MKPLKSHELGERLQGQREASLEQEAEEEFEVGEAQCGPRQAHLRLPRARLPHSPRRVPGGQKWKLLGGIAKESQHSQKCGKGMRWRRRV